MGESREHRIQAERTLLAALCRATLAPESRSAILARLNNHAFAAADHQVIYRALASISSSADRADLPRTLAQAVTRLGFPDLDLDVLLHTPPPTAQEISAAFDQL
jgi:replicative DNA helicase